MAGQSKKSTKKFEKNHLKDTIERRKEGKKIKQRQQVKAKKKAKIARENGGVSPQPEKPAASSKPSAKANKEDNPFGDMNVDEFFQGGFDVPEISTKTAKASKVKEGTEKTKKRKRIEPEEEGDDLSSSSSVEENAVRSDSEPGSEAEDDFDNHKGELDALAEKDPEFYKFLQENDSELLDFDEMGNLAEVDALSGTDDESAPKKKRKKSKKDVEDLDEGVKDEDSGNEVTMAALQKWKAALNDQHSLRAMRQVVLAFRAAAHVNEDDGKEYKYTISSSDGKWTLVHSAAYCS